MDKNDLRLNQCKRKALKIAWKDVVWKRTPTEFDSKLYDAISNFKQHEKDVWDSVVKPIVEKKFPPSKMEILKEFDLTTHDSCFYFKPSFADDKQRQFRFAYTKEDMTAIHHDELINLGVNPNLELEYDNDKARNPYYYSEEKRLDAKLEGFHNPRYLTSRGYSNQYDHDIDESDVGRMGGFALLVPDSGGCSTRVMMCDSQFDWKKLTDYDVSRREMIVAQQKLYEHKAKVILTMNEAIDQAKFIDDVRPYWPDLEDCVNFDNDMGKALSIVSEESKQALLNTYKIRQAEKELLAVIRTPRENALV